MRNPELPCARIWEGDVCEDGDRCTTHAECPYWCGDAGFFYVFEPGDTGFMESDTDWEAHKRPCRCRTGVGGGEGGKGDE